MRKKASRRFAGVAASAVVALTFSVLWFGLPARSFSGWSFTVLPGTFEKVDNLVFGPNGSLYATIERERHGQIVRILPRRETIVSGLFSPDGLAYRSGHLFVTEEKAGNGQVIRVNLKNGERQVIATLNSPEGIDVEEDGSVVVVEDASPARLVRIAASGSFEVLSDRLKRAEGLIADRKGKFYVTETNKGRVVRIDKGKLAVVVDGLSKPDQIKKGPDEAVWITEDRLLDRLLRFKDGSLEVMADRLRFPQGLAFDRQGNLYLAEQGRDRILIFKSDTSGEASRSGTL